jgi:hypothetical protein
MPPPAGSAILADVDPETDSGRAYSEPITVTFNEREGPVAGTVSSAGGDPTHFHGWLELMDDLERLRRTPAGETAASPG